MQQTNTTPLWRELFNLSYKKPLKTEYQQYEDGSHICLATDTGDWVADFGNEGDKLGEVTAKYAALSVNNLHKLAEALTRIREASLQGLEMHANGEKFSFETLAGFVAEISGEALTSIS